MSRYIEYHDICSAIDNQQDGTGMTYEALAHCERKSKGKVRTFRYADDFCSYGERREP